MLQLIHRDRIPYGGNYSLTDAERGLVGQGNDFWKVVDKVTQYRKANGIPVGLGLGDEVEAALCAKYPDECIDRDPHVPRDHRFSWREVVAGSRVMVNLAKWKLSGNKLESEEVANQRAETCSKCKWNKPFTRPCGWVCGELKQFVESCTGNKQTKHGDKLNACSICHCYLSAAVWVPLEVQCAGVTAGMREQFKSVPHCWKQCA